MRRYLYANFNNLFNFAFLFDYCNVIHVDIKHLSVLLYSSLFVMFCGNNWSKINPQVKKDEDFCKLKVSSKIEDFKPGKKIRILLNIFHTEVNT